MVPPVLIDGRPPPPPAGPPAAPPGEAERAMAFWRRVRGLTLALLLAWAAVTLGAPWYARELNQWTVGRFPLGFWFCAEGAILAFLAIIALYDWVMSRWEAAWHAAHRAAAAAPPHDHG